MRKFADLTERELLALAISNEEEDGRIYADYAEGLRVEARAPDGVIEGTEDPSLPFYVGVQWHPERQNDEGDHLAIFKALVAAARKNESPPP